VFPPISDREAPTAYSKIRNLEAVDGPAARLADRQAATLRGEFAKTLVEHGNRLWEIPGARPLARDYYAWGLLFDRSDAQAFERSGLSSGALADLAERLENGQFTTAELALARAAAAAVETDPTKKAAAEEELAAAQAELSREGLDAAEASGVKVARRKAAEPPPEPAPTDDADRTKLLEAVLLEEPTDAAPAEPAVDPAVEAEVEKRKKIKKDMDAMLGSGKRDPAKADALAKQGSAALRAGRRSEAESLFNQAVAFDRSSGQALMGLSDVYFDTGSDQKAVLYAERAVKAEASNRTYRLKLGDAYFKVLRYHDALAQYEEAKRMGESRADQRITRVKSKLGG
jgi:tetratricopeptide (TPR) repeat protein